VVVVCCCCPLFFGNTKKYKGKHLKPLNLEGQGGENSKLQVLGINDHRFSEIVYSSLIVFFAVIVWLVFELDEPKFTSMLTISRRLFPAHCSEQARFLALSKFQKLEVADFTHFISFSRSLGGGFKYFLFSPLLGEDSQPVMVFFSLHLARSFGMR